MGSSVGVLVIHTQDGCPSAKKYLATISGSPNLVNCPECKAAAKRKSKYSFTTWETWTYFAYICFIVIVALVRASLDTLFKASEEMLCPLRVDWWPSEHVRVALKICWVLGWQASQCKAGALSGPLCSGMIRRSAMPYQFEQGITDRGLEKV